jgi:hypothetical protein
MNLYASEDETNTATDAGHTALKCADTQKHDASQGRLLCTPYEEPQTEPKLRRAVCVSLKPATRQVHNIKLGVVECAQDTKSDATKLGAEKDPYAARNDLGIT